MAVSEPTQHKWEAEAQENLRFIRELMDRPTRHSTFSGLSGVVAGCTALAGCALTYRITLVDAEIRRSGFQFVIVWAAVVFIALIADFLITKRPAARVGKVLLSRLGHQMFLAAVPALFTGGLLTLFFWQHQLLPWIYPVWMLTYGCAVCSVAAFSPAHVRLLGCAFLAFGVVALVMPRYGLLFTALSFGLGHITYGILVSPGADEE